MAGLRVVSDLDGLATFGEASQRAGRALCLFGGVLVSSICAHRQGGSAIVPAVDQVSLDDGRGPAFIVDRDLDDEPGSGELLGGAVDDRDLRFAVAGVGDVPRSERPAPPPAVGLESIGRAVAPAGPFDEGAFRGRVDDREHHGRLPSRAAASCVRGWRNPISRSQTSAARCRPSYSFTPRWSGESTSGR